MTRWQKWLSFRPWTRHSTALLLGGGIYFVYGITLIQLPVTQQRENSLKFLFDLACPEVWGGVFIAVGILAILSTIWPPKSKTWGYTCMSGLAGTWGAAYLANGWGQSVNGALIWLLLASLWFVIAGLLDPADVVKN